MPKAGEIKKNSAVEYEGGVYFVKDIERSVPQGRAGGSLYRMRLYEVVTGQKIDQTFKDSDMLNLADLVRRPATFSYSDGTEYVFMDNEDYTQYSLNGAAIADAVYQRRDPGVDGGSRERCAGGPGLAPDSGSGH